MRRRSLWVLAKPPTEKFLVCKMLAATVEGLAAPEVKKVGLTPLSLSLFFTRCWVWVKVLESKVLRVVDKLESGCDSWTRGSGKRTSSSCGLVFTRVRKR